MREPVRHLDSLLATQIKSLNTAGKTYQSAKGIEHRQRLCSSSNWQSCQRHAAHQQLLEAAAVTTRGPSTYARTRPLRDDERSLLNHLLDIKIPGIEELRAQAAQAEVYEESRLPFNLDLHVPEDRTPPATDIRKHVPIQAHSLRDDEHGLHVTLWMRGDYLDHIEISWYDTEPTRLPRPDELRPSEPF